MIRPTALLCGNTAKREKVTTQMGPATRRNSTPVGIGKVTVGGSAPIVVQSMTNTDTADVASTVAQVEALARCGSELVRITVDRDESARAVPKIRERLEARGDEYRRFIVDLRNNPAVYDGAEVLSGGKLEDFKTNIQERLRYRHREEANEDVGRRIYLSCDRQDVDLVAPLRDYLTSRGFKVTLPFKDKSEVRSNHKENLRRCDSLLIFYGREESTVQGKLKELPKIDVYRDGKPLLAMGVYVGGRETEHKRAFDAEGTLVMKNFGKFEPEAVSPFLEAVEKHTRGAHA